MIPLWMIANDPSDASCGWALTSFGAPCVAHRVCPTPTVPSTGRASSSFASSSTFPSFLRTSSDPLTTATPAES